jgi:pimeloyl-ACP methyl ester carboxylesterase
VGLLLLALVGALAFCSFTTRLRETAPRAASAPSSGRFVRAADVQVFLQEAGPADGPPLLLLHGTGAWGELWRETMTFLAGQGYRAIAIDIPPFGYSEKALGADTYRTDRQAQRLAGVLDALGLKEATIIAHSVGSRPAVELALVAPERVRALVLIDPALGFAPRRPGEPARFQQNDPPALQRTFFAVRPLRDALLGATATNPTMTRTLFEGFVSKREAVTAQRVVVLRQPLCVEGTTRSYGDWFENLMESADSSRSSDFANFGTLRMPVLLVWGDADTITPLWQGEELRRLIPGSTLSPIEGAGHIPHLESPAAVQKALGEFLGTTLRGKGS